MKSISAGSRHTSLVLSDIESSSGEEAYQLMEKI